MWKCYSIYTCKDPSDTYRTLRGNRISDNITAPFWNQLITMFLEGFSRILTENIGETTTSDKIQNRWTFVHFAYTNSKQICIVILKCSLLSDEKPRKETEMPQLAKSLQFSWLDRKQMWFKKIKMKKTGFFQRYFATLTYAYGLGLNIPNLLL